MYYARLVLGVGCLQERRKLNPCPQENLSYKNLTAILITPIIHVTTLT